MEQYSVAAHEGSDFVFKMKLHMFGLLQSCTFHEVQVGRDNSGTFNLDSALSRKLGNSGDGTVLATKMRLDNSDFARSRTLFVLPTCPSYHGLPVYRCP